jgi:nucleotide-binding universal stress UspA family protein
MTNRLSVLCPVDFSESSRRALSFALAIARRYHAAVTVLNVNDPLLAEVGDARMGAGWSDATTVVALKSFAGETPGVEVTFDVSTGKPPSLIVEAARAGGHQLIVMSTHGRSGVNKLLFGTVAERVLRETTIPVLLVPADAHTPAFEELTQQAPPVLAPVDFGSATAAQVKAAAQIAHAFGARLIVGHVIEPIAWAVHAPIDEGELIAERHRRACQGLRALADSGLEAAPEIQIASGQPAEEIARWVREYHAGLLVMAMHSGGTLGPRLGAVTYRAIALARVLTLALPPSA